MMASTISALLCGLAALVLWAGTGFVLARRLPIERSLVLPVAPILGWAVQNAIALPAAMVIGLSPVVVVGVAAAICALAAIGAPANDRRDEGAAVPWLAFGVAAIVALAPAAAILPKVSGDAVFLAAPIFDHSKIALIDEIVRDGVPPGNPVFAAGGGAGSLAYYYLWHFAAAQLSRLTGASGWEADIASTWFTAFATLALMSGLAVHFGKRRTAAFIVPILACCGSLRPVLIWLFGKEQLDAWLQRATGLGGWLFQVTWSPHHVASAACLVLAVFVMAKLAERPSAYATAVLACLVAAAFGSSIWVGGVTLAIAGGAVALAQGVAASPQRRLVLLACWSSAAVAALALSWPILSPELQAVATRGTGIPIAIEPTGVLGPAFGEVRRFLDIPAYWLVLLPLEFPALVLAGALVGALGLRTASKGPKPAGLMELGLLVAASLVCGWLLLSTLSRNNDLGWRAVLPAVLVMTAFAAAGIAHWLARPAKALAAAALAVALALPDGALLMAGYIQGDATPDGAIFAHDPELWDAVRRYAGNDERIADNPLHASGLTPWPINISWALLANRRSCFANADLALALVSQTPEERAAIAARFARAFDGRGSEDDVTALAWDYGCRVVVLTPDDGAWAHDVFATSPRYHEVEVNPDRWRIYVATGSGTTSK